MILHENMKRERGRLVTKEKKEEKGSLMRLYKIESRQRPLRCLGCLHSQWGHKRLTLYKWIREYRFVWNSLLVHLFLFLFSFSFFRFILSLSLYLSLYLSPSLYLFPSRARGHAFFIAITLPVFFVAEGHKDSKTELFSWCVSSVGSCSACL